jgi:lipoprotein NlpI
MRTSRLTVAAVVLCVAGPAVFAQDATDLMIEAQKALAEGKAKEAQALADKAVARAPKDPEVYRFRGGLYEKLQRFADAVRDYTRALELDPKDAELYNLRGSAHFKAGQIAPSLADFDAFLKLRPEERNGHWRRGISCYYAGRFAEGKKQFEGYENVDRNDVENAVWHFLCAARADGVAKARAAMLKVGTDRRIPLMEIDALFRGKAKPADVLTAARAGNPPPEPLKRRLFYAHLYLGLYFDVHGDRKQALEHLTKAADEYRIDHYMGDVARVARNTLLASTKK